MVNKHCDSVSIEVAYNLMERLGIKQKGEFARLCGVEHVTFNRWERKGVMPQYQLSALREELCKKFKREYDQKMSLIYEE